MAMRSRSCEGNCTCGPRSAEEVNRGHSDIPVATRADCARKRLRVMSDKAGTVYQIWGSPGDGAESPDKPKGAFSKTRSGEGVGQLEHSPDGCGWHSIVC